MCAERHKSFYLGSLQLKLYLTKESHKHSLCTLAVSHSHPHSDASPHAPVVTAIVVFEPNMSRSNHKTDFSNVYVQESINAPFIYARDDWQTVHADWAACVVRIRHVRLSERDTPIRGHHTNANDRREPKNVQTPARQAAIRSQTIRPPNAKHRTKMINRRWCMGRLNGKNCCDSRPCVSIMFLRLLLALCSET